MFKGKFYHTLDAKNRTIVPSKLRDELGDTFVITVGLEGCLYIYPNDEWEAFAEELKKLPQIKEVRGQGLMIGMEFAEPIKEVRRKLLFEQKVFTGVSGTNVIRLLPPLCLSMEEAKEFLKRFKKVL